MAGEKDEQLAAGRVLAVEVAGKAVGVVPEDGFDLGGAGVFYDLGFEAKAAFQFRGDLPGVGDGVAERGQRGFVGVDGEEDGVVFAGAESCSRMRLGAGGGEEQGEAEQEEDSGLSH